MPQKSKKKFINVNKKTVIILSVLLFLLLLLSIYIITPSLRFLRKINATPSFLASLALTNDPPLKKYENRTNLLLLGIPGRNHEGVDLTDTMIFISIDYSKNDILMISLPRDIWLESMKDKLNTAYHYGESKKEGGGFILAKSSVEEVVGVPIQYVLLIDFDGFEKMVDLVGGIDVNVEKSFTDQKFPIEGKEDDLCGGDPDFKCRYETISFEKGINHMDGEIALKFVRSRNASSEEGTDFARSKRQQEVLVAFQKKLISFENISSSKISELTKIIEKTIHTDLSFQEAAYLAKFAVNLDGKVRSIVLDEGDEEKNIKGFLINPPVEKYGRWVLAPRTGNFEEIHQYIACHLKDPLCSISPN